MRCRPSEVSESVLVVLDLQSSILQHMPGSERLVGRARFLVEVAQLLGVPVIQSEQNPTRLGGTDESLQAVLQPQVRVEKTTFSAAAWPPFMDGLRALGRRRVVVTGIETHICVAQTLCGLIDQGYETIACTDALGARTVDRHEAGLDLLRSAGVMLSHSESVVYDWLKDSAHPKFKEALQIVKNAPL